MTLNCLYILKKHDCCKFDLFICGFFIPVGFLMLWWYDWIQGRCGQQVHISLQLLLVQECCLWHGLLLRLAGLVVQQLWYYSLSSLTTLLSSSVPVTAPATLSPERETTLTWMLSTPTSVNCHLVSFVRVTWEFDWYSHMNRWIFKWSKSLRLIMFSLIYHKTLKDV